MQCRQQAKSWLGEHYQVKHRRPPIIKMVEKACYWPQMILHLNITKIFVIVSWLNPSRVSVFICGEDCPGAGYLLSPGQLISIVRRWSPPSDCLSPGLCGQGLWILLVCISISQVIFARLTDGEVAFIQLRIKSRPCAGARVKLYNQYSGTDTYWCWRVWSWVEDWLNWTLPKTSSCHPDNVMIRSRLSVQYWQIGRVACYNLLNG